jgi:hypothetical protein
VPHASGNWNAASEWATDEPPFSPDELAEALALRQAVLPDYHPKRRDRCPHQTPCATVEQCVAFIAWYRRHQREIESFLRTSEGAAAHA